MKTPFPRLFLVVLAALCLPVAPRAQAEKEETLNVLFIGNSFTARHNLAQVVKAMAEAGNPGLTFQPTSVIYGGRTLADHWRLGTQNIVKIASLTEAEEKQTVAALEKAIADDPKDKYALSALARHRDVLANLESQRTHWDVVILQSYRDDLEGEKSRYAEYAPKFVELAKAQGAKVLLYVTTPTTQNAEALTSPPDPAPVQEKARAIAALASRLDVAVAPMSLIALRCQTERPDLTLRFVNDAHLNQTMAYLSACAIYAGLFEKSPVGLPIDSVTDIRYLDDKSKDKDRDGDPITRTFSEKDRADLQRIAWEGHLEFEKLRKP
ncbi:MAG: hypothetical protein KDN20_03305 [Verrucomicrobiae bacterium]|nr:hypothetical protein [Verrucomicrobiae bacterium]